MSAESVALKIELKSWENQFQNTYGRKPTPDDIRAAGLGTSKLVVTWFVNICNSSPLAFTADKYKKWKALKKEEDTMNKAALLLTMSHPPSHLTHPVTPPRRTNTKPAEPTSIIKRTKPTIQDRDAEPVAAKVNPFSPRKRPEPFAASPSAPFASTSASMSSLTKLVFPPPPPSVGTSTSPLDDPDNPFSAVPLSAATTSSSQFDSPFTKARKRLRGEDVEMDDAALVPHKKRRSLNRSQSASQSTIWSRTGSAANALRPDPGRQQGEAMDDEVLGPSPLKKGRYKTIFDDSPPVPVLAFGKGVSRTNSLPAGAMLFGKKKPEALAPMERVEGQLATPLSSSTRVAPSGKRKRSGSGTRSECEGEERSTGSLAVLGLIPPSPPPIKESDQQQSRWKGKGRSATGKGKKKAKMVSEETSEEEDNAVDELAWTPVGPLKRRSQAADVDAEPDLELEDPIIAHSKARLLVAAEEPEQEGDFEIDLPDQLKDILALTPSTRSKDAETIVRNLLTGKGEFLSNIEIWAAGEVPENHSDDDDDWDGEPVGWWEAEL